MAESTDSGVSPHRGVTSNRFFAREFSPFHAEVDRSPYCIPPVGMVNTLEVMLPSMMAVRV